MSKAKRKPAYFLPFFALLVILDLWVVGIGEEGLRHYTKPLILFSLIMYFAINGRTLGKRTYNLTLMALIFSWLGDVFLMYESISSNYFIIGLASFLTAHFLYSIVFFRHRNTPVPSNFWVVFILLLLYGSILFYLLKAQLGALLVPVILYVIMILMMALLAYGRKGKVNQQSYTWVFIGALFFIASDSFLAIDKFLVTVPYGHFLVMVTYAIAQFLITEGILNQDETIYTRKKT